MIALIRTNAFGLNGVHVQWALEHGMFPYIQEGLILTNALGLND
jgi:hypothetical protein